MPQHLRITAAFLGSFVILGMVCSEGVQAGSLEPAAPPGPTMHTLEQTPPSWDQVLPANDGPDSCNSSRFTCVMGGVAVRDNETGLIWEKVHDVGVPNWSGAIGHCINKQVGGRKGWRLPSVHELTSLIDTTVASPGPTLPPGHPFTVLTVEHHWTATSVSDDGPLSLY
jgi:hypothetical protein